MSVAENTLVDCRSIWPATRPKLQDRSRGKRYSAGWDVPESKVHRNSRHSIAPCRSFIKHPHRHKIANPITNELRYPAQGPQLNSLDDGESVDGARADCASTATHRPALFKKENLKILCTIYIGYV